MAFEFGDGLAEFVAFGFGEVGVVVDAAEEGDDGERGDFFGDLVGGVFGLGGVGFSAEDEEGCGAGDDEEGGDGGGAAEVEKTEFDVVLTGFGDKKLNVVKVVKNLTGASLMEAKKMVEGVPATLKEGIAKDEAEKVKAEIEEAGGTVELK